MTSETVNKFAAWIRLANETIKLGVTFWAIHKNPALAERIVAEYERAK